MWITVFILLISLPSLSANQNQTEREFFEKYKKNIPNAPESKYTYGPLKIGQDFNCKENLAPSTSIPTSVHKLRPADIKVVAAVGDSITAGFGEAATNVINLPTEWRGRSWTIGGEKAMKDLVNVPGVLKEYQGKVYGYATGTGGPSSSNAKFNVAVSGAIAQGIPGQVNSLIDKMKKDSNVDYNNDWKLVSLWIGGNDLCAACNGNSRNFPANYNNYIKTALDTLRAQMPRTFVNLISIVDVTLLYEVHDGDCDFWHGVVCKCGTSTDSKIRDLVRDYFLQYNELIAKTADSYNNLDDFTVVYQPFFEKTTIPTVGGKPDRSYFSVDCFHFTEKAHDAGAVALWNNMFEPYGKKSDDWHPGETIICPGDKYPYLFTYQNSVDAAKTWIRNTSMVY